jgi:hypothetical protein
MNQSVSFIFTEERNGNKFIHDPSRTHSCGIAECWCADVMAKHARHACSCVCARVCMCVCVVVCVCVWRGGGGVAGALRECCGSLLLPPRQYLKATLAPAPPHPRTLVSPSPPPRPPHVPPPPPHVCPVSGQSFPAAFSAISSFSGLCAYPSRRREKAFRNSSVDALSP